MRLAFTANRIFFKKNEKHVQFFSVFVYIGVRRALIYKEQSLGNYPVTTRKCGYWLWAIGYVRRVND